jgi:hypothetical protein
MRVETGHQQATHTTSLCRVSSQVLVGRDPVQVVN